MRGFRITLLIISIFSFNHEINAQKWLNYYDSASTYWGGNWEKSVTYLEKSRQIALQDLGIYDANYLNISNDLGLALWNSGKVSKAVRMLEEVHTIKAELYESSNVEYQKSLINLGNIYTALGKDSSALNMYEQVGFNPEASSLYWTAIDGIINICHTNDEYNVKDYFAPKLTLYNNASGRTKNDDMYATLILSKYALMNESVTAADSLISQIDEVKIHSSEKQDLIALYQLTKGSIYFNLSKYNLAEIALLQALKFSSPGTDMHISAISQIAAVYDQTGRYNLAEKNYLKALDQCRNSNNFSCLLIENNLANLYLTIQNPSKAQHIFEGLLVRYPNLSFKYQYLIKFGLAVSLLNQNEFDKSLRELDRLLTYEDKLSPVQHADILYHCGLANLLNNNLSRSKDLLSQTLSIYESLYGKESVQLKNTLTHLALATWELGDNESSIGYLNRSLNLIQNEISYIFPSLTIIEQDHYYQQLKHEFEKFYSLILADSKPDPELLVRLYQHQIHVKGLLFNYERQRSELIGRSNNPNLKEDYEKLKTLRSSIAAYYKDNLKNDELSGTQAELQLLEKKLSSRLTSLPSNETKTWKKMQEGLGSKDAFVNIIQFRKFASSNESKIKRDGRVRYGFTDSTYYAALITTSTTLEAPELVVLGHGEYLEDRAINFYKNAINFDVRDGNTYKYYWEPIDDKLHDIERIYLSNDGVYHTINLEAIYDKKSDRLLADKYDIVYTLNPGVKPNYNTTWKADKSVLLVGNPFFGNNSATNGTSFQMLPGTGKEISSLNINFQSNGWKPYVFTGIKATSKNISQHSDVGIIHIATHGFYNENNKHTNSDAMMSAGLVLATQPQSEMNTPEILTAYEVSNFNLSKTELVFLSACETAKGKLENGEGVYGLQRSFLSAGANNIITSLWRIDDHITQKFVTTFYKYLLDGTQLDKALKLTKKDIRAIHPEPKYWAPFILTSI